MFSSLLLGMPEVFSFRPFNTLIRAALPKSLALLLRVFAFDGLVVSNVDADFPKEWYNQEATRS